MGNFLRRLAIPLIATKIATFTPSIANTPVLSSAYTNTQKIASSTVSTALNYVERTAEFVNVYGALDPKKIVAYTTFEILRNKHPIEATVTAYTLMECGKPKDSPYYGITASLTEAKEGITVATDPDHKGKIVYIPTLDPSNEKFLKLDPDLQRYFQAIRSNGYFKAEDVGGAIKGNDIDVYFGENKFNLARFFGTRTLEAYIIDDASELMRNINSTADINPVTYIFGKESRN